MGKRKGRVLGTDPDPPTSSFGAGEPVSLWGGGVTSGAKYAQGLTVPGA